VLRPIEPRAACIRSRTARHSAMNSLSQASRGPGMSNSVCLRMPSQPRCLCRERNSALYGLVATAAHLFRAMANCRHGAPARLGHAHHGSYCGYRGSRRSVRRGPVTAARVISQSPSQRFLSGLVELSPASKPLLYCSRPGRLPLRKKIDASVSRQIFSAPKGGTLCAQSHETVRDNCLSYFHLSH